VVDENIRRLVHENAGEQAIRRQAQAKGMRSMRDDSARWVRDGITSLEEIARVTRDV
jgi:general secretion pathway protein E